VTTKKARPIVITTISAYIFNFQHNDNVIRVSDKQDNFLRTLRERADYSKHVRAISWTLIYRQRDEESDDNWDEDEYEDVDGNAYLPAYCDSDRRSNMWYLLGTLKNVIYVELSERRSYLSKSIPRRMALFPKVTSLSLIGDLTDRFVYSVLSSTKKISQLKYLSLDHVEVDKCGPPALGRSTVPHLKILTGRCTLKSVRIFHADFRLRKKEGEQERCPYWYQKFSTSLNTFSLPLP